MAFLERHDLPRAMRRNRARREILEPFLNPPRVTAFAIGRSYRLWRL